MRKEFLDFVQLKGTLSPSLTHHIIKGFIQLREISGQRGKAEDKHLMLVTFHFSDSTVIRVQTLKELKPFLKLDFAHFCEAQSPSVVALDLDCG